ncbi:MAG: serine/threonine protein kinase [Elusimicrobia bacterium]|nr:serine/threonine protein kinase [Elusimicrobiota bacterium]
MPDPLEGKLLGGCRIERRLGEGGMGVVYKAHHLRLDRPVAVKLLAPALTANPGSVTAFQREARAAARLEHPRIVQVYDANRDQGHYFIIMQFVDGETLQNLLRREKKLGPMDALRIIKAAMEGLSEAHKHSIIHRDVKPGNILLGKDGSIRLSDFGLAFRIKDPSVDPKKELAGTPEYMAPEMGWGGEADERTDIYAMGVTYFEMLSGDVPYSGPTAADTLTMHLNHPLPDIRGFNPDVTDMAAKVIAKMMAKSREDRYMAVDDVLKDLNAPGMLIQQFDDFHSDERVLDLGLDVRPARKAPPAPPPKPAPEPISIRPEEPDERRPPEIAPLEPEGQAPARKKLGVKSAVSAVLLLLAAAASYWAGCCGKYPVLGVSAAGLAGACVLMKAGEDSAFAIALLLLGGLSLFISGQTHLSAIPALSAGWLRIQLFPLGLILAGAAVERAQRMEKSLKDSFIVGGLSLAMCAALLLFAAPDDLSAAAAAALADPKRVSLILVAAALGASLAAGLFDRLETRQGNSPVLPYPLLAVAALSALLAGGFLHPATAPQPAAQDTRAAAPPAASKPPAGHEKSLAGVPFSQWRRALLVPFDEYPDRFRGSNGPFPLGVALSFLGIWFLVRPRTELRPEELFPESDE